MKGIVLVILTVILVYSVALADTAEYSSMPFDELSAAKKALDAEFYSRPESAGMLLETGTYVVGETVKPGQYYAAMVKPDPLSPNTSLYIYKDYETFLREEPYSTRLAQYSGYFFLNDDPKSIILEDKNVVNITYGSLLLKTTGFEASDFYAYEAPAGTLVPKGRYIVGTDIPAGTYNTYPGTASGGEFGIRVLNTKADGYVEELQKPGYNYIIYLYIQREIGSERIELEDGDLLIVNQSIIMAKTKMLQIE